jgi:hypothetical protein
MHQLCRSTPTVQTSDSDDEFLYGICRAPRCTSTPAPVPVAVYGPEFDIAATSAFRAMQHMSNNSSDTTIAACSVRLRRDPSAPQSVCCLPDSTLATRSNAAMRVTSVQPVQVVRSVGAAPPPHPVPLHYWRTAKPPTQPLDHATPPPGPLEPVPHDAPPHLWRYDARLKDAHAYTPSDLILTPSPTEIICAIHKRLSQAVALHNPIITTLCGQVSCRAYPDDIVGFCVKHIDSARAGTRFKVGITHNPTPRWHNPKFGYKFEDPAWGCMIVLWASHLVEHACWLEKRLIKYYRDGAATGLWNIRRGGDSPPPAPPVFVYCVIGFPQMARS